MPELNSNFARTTHKAISSFADFCVYNAWSSCANTKEKLFVGIKIEDSQPRIYFPMGYRTATPSEDICKQDFYRLVAVLSDTSLQSYFSEDDLKKSQLDFPFYAYLSVLQYYLDFGYFVESETIYKKGFSGKINWPRTIKKIKPQVVKNEDDPSHIRYQVVYLNLITRKTSYREDNLITLVHKYCVKEAARLIGPFYGISDNEVEEPELLFDYELFAEAIQDKISATFNDKHLELFHAMLKMVRYLGNRENLGEDKNGSEAFFGVNTFAPVWEMMVDKIFGTVSDKSNYNPHLRFVEENDKDLEGLKLDDDGDTNEKLRSTLRPDTIMVCEDKTFVLDSKFYRYGMTGAKSHLPGAESVCKQMAYAEYVQTEMNVDEVYNAFILPYCADEEKWNGTNAKFSENGMFKMCRVGYIYGDWKNMDETARGNEKQNVIEKTKFQPYHKIYCLLLDLETVMHNYSASSDAQKALANLIIR